MKNKRVNAFLIGIMSAVLFCGCGSNAGRANVDAGMQAIAAMDYASAMESFQMAKDKGENLNVQKIFTLL